MWTQVAEQTRHKVVLTNIWNKKTSYRCVFVFTIKSSWTNCSTLNRLKQHVLVLWHSRSTSHWIISLEKCPINNINWPQHEKKIITHTFNKSFSNATPSHSKVGFYNTNIATTSLKFSMCNSTQKCVIMDFQQNQRVYQNRNTKLIWCGIVNLFCYLIYIFIVHHLFSFANR